MINLEKRTGVRNEDMPSFVSTAEVATLQLEFRYLSQLTGDDDYWRKVENVRPVAPSIMSNESNFLYYNR